MEFKILNKKMVAQRLQDYVSKYEEKELLVRSVDILNQFLWGLGYKDIHEKLNHITRKTWNPNLSTESETPPGFESHSDQYLIRKAVRERWPISAEIREKVVDETVKVLDDPTLDSSIKLTAARTIVGIDTLNLKEKELKIRAQPKHIIHTNMSTEELEDRIKKLQQELGLALPEEALKRLNHE